MAYSLRMTGLDGSPREIEGSAIALLRNTLRGQLLGASDEGFDHARTIFNGIHDIRPALIARCTGVADVLDIVKFAREHELLISIRGGGHSVAGTALCEGGLVIDLSQIRGVRVDPVSRIADVGPGATLGDVDRETQAFGLVAPAGVVSTTGIAGLTLAGGVGWLRRKYGMTIDNLLSVDIVTADGAFLRASATENEDLFWAVRGGGGNFGVITSFRFRLHSLGPMVYFAAPMFAAERASEILRKWRDFCTEASDEITSTFLFQTLPRAAAFPEAVWDRQVVALPAVYAGPVDEGETKLRPLREMGQTLLDLSGPLPFCALQQAFDWLLPAGGRYYWKTTTLPDLNDNAIDTLVELGAARSSPQSMMALLQMGGAMARVAPDATGYGSRSALWTVTLDSAWTDAAEDDRHISSTRAAWERLQSVSDGGLYLNYGSLEKEQQIQAAYGTNYPRLVEIKNRYDPMNLFRVNQNIRPSRLAAV